MPRINWTTTREDCELIGHIAARAALMVERVGVDYPKIELMMDLTATHANGCPLRLRDLLAADEMNFAHDIFGIRRHINRNTGKMEDSFVPRFAR